MLISTLYNNSIYKDIKMYNGIFCLQTLSDEKVYLLISPYLAYFNIIKSLNNYYSGGK